MCRPWTVWLSQTVSGSDTLAPRLPVLFLLLLPYLHSLRCRYFTLQIDQSNDVTNLLRFEDTPLRLRSLYGLDYCRLLYISLTISTFVCWYRCSCMLRHSTQLYTLKSSI
jgi:hypothetical protein